MTITGRQWLRPELVIAAAFLLYPLSGLEGVIFGFTQRSVGSDLTFLFIFGILALGLNVVVGYSGQLHLGIAAFFAAGAYIAAILTVPAYPFQIGFVPGIICATVGAGIVGLILGAPALRLRGDYLALVTLGFGEVARFALRNFEFTGGSRGLNPLPPPPSWLTFGSDWVLDYQPFYYLNLLVLLVVYLALCNLENSRVGRAWMAVREDELAATCLGIRAVPVKLSAFALGAALAGLAGCLYATKLGNTAGPDAYDFNRSMIILCCVILGGLGSLRGVLLGVFILIGFDNIVAPIVDRWFQSFSPTGQSRFLVFSNYRLMIFGLVLIIVMRLRPAGLLPSNRIKDELRDYRPPKPPESSGTSTIVRPRRAQSN